MTVIDDKDRPYGANPLYTQGDWEDVSDNPPLSEDQLERLRPAAEVLPAELHARLLAKGGRPKAEKTKVSVTLRIDPDTLAAFRSSGPGWQTRMNDILTSAAPRTKRRA